MRRIVFGIVGLLGLAFAAAPASAVSVPDCGGDFIIFAKDRINFEGGNTILFGDIFVQSPTGQVIVGANNTLHGTLSANKIIVGNGAVVDACVANTITLLGTGKCTTSTIGFNPTAACLAAAPLVLPAFPTSCIPGTVFQPTASTSLAPGCYSNVRLGAGVTVTLTPGGTYNFKGTELRLLDAADLISGTGQPDSAATVNVQGNLTLVATSSPGNPTSLNNLLVNVLGSGGQAVQIGNGALLRDTVINAPKGNVHPHVNTALRGDTELIGLTFFDIEPINNEVVNNPHVCACEPGFKFATGPTTDPPQPDRVCVPITVP